MIKKICTIDKIKKELDIDFDNLELVGSYKTARNNVYTGKSMEVLEFLCYNLIYSLYKLYKEGDLMELLKLKRAEYFNTKKALIENDLIKIDTDKNIIILN